MSVNVDELRALPTEEKMRLVELLWDELGSTIDQIPLPSWAEQEAANRRDEMLRNTSYGMTHDEVWGHVWDQPN